PGGGRAALATRYATGRPARGRGFAHLPDLAVAFVERALELAAPGGTAALLVPAKLASSGYAEPLRRRLAEGARVERVAPLPAAGNAFAARSEEHTSELQSQSNLVCRLLLEKKK